MTVYRLPQLIERAAAATPDQVAFCCLDESLTYADLLSRSRRLAGVLRELGVHRHDRVGVYLHKGLETAVAIYAVMLAGAAYVPLDPAAPVSRLADIVRDCGIRVLITHKMKRRGVRQLLGAGAALDAVVGLSPAADDGVARIPWAEALAAAESAPACGLGHDLAYIMYTSGSTGLPKGIMHTHDSGLAYARLAVHTYGLRADDRLANFAPLHFDQSTFEYFAGPLVGATTVIVPEPHMKLPASLSQLIADERVTIWYSVPYALIQLLLRGVLEERDMGALRWVIYGGEPFPPRYLNALKAAWPGARFSNAYGPAEVNQCTYYHLPEGPLNEQRPVPIGRVWANTDGLVVDDDDRPVATGEVGELLIHSPTMMAGYWGRPSGDVFFRREVVPGHTTTYYRTGDLVREDTDGLLHFIGRRDRQIKTRGFRVELDEVEAALVDHPAVEEAAVYAVADDAGSRRIEAAVIVAGEEAVTAPVLLAHLRAALPAYALPEAIHFQTAFPRTSSGKIDRRALRDAAGERVAAPVAP